MLSVLIWMQADIFVVNYGTLDGSLYDFSQYSYRENIELFILVLVLLFSILFQKQINRHLPFVLLLIVMGQIGVVVYKTFSEPNDKVFINKLDDEFFKFSSKKNVILIILDTFGANYFKTIRNQNPDVTNEFTGFVNYTDAISNYPETRGSVPSLLTGKMLPESTEVQSYIDNEVAQIGLPNLFDKKGYLVSVVSVYPWFDKFYQKRFMVEPPLTKPLNSFYGNRLLDYSLFRSLPHVLKPKVYNNGLWMLSKSFAEVENLPNTNPEKGELMLRLITNKANVNGQTPRFKMIHVMLPHPEFIFDNMCNQVDPVGSDSQLMLDQSKCALKRLSELLIKFKELNIYDSSLIAVISDHGSRIINDKSINGFPSYYEMVNSGVLFMIKGINQRGKFSDVETPVSLLKLYDMFNNESKHQSKIDFLADSNRKFLSFHRKNTQFNDYFPDAPYFTVAKGYNDPKSWTLDKFVIQECKPLKLPNKIVFTKNGREKYCSKFGFSDPDRNEHGIWTESKDVRMFLKLDLLSRSIVKFEINYSVFKLLISKNITMSWFVNDTLIKSQKINSNLSSTVLNVPIELLKSKDLTEIKIKFSSLLSSDETIINSDSRKLGILVENIIID